jgi:hypothetical protein
MPGTVHELSVDEAIALIMAAQHDPPWLAGTGGATLVAEAQRVIEQHASDIAARHLAPSRPSFKIIAGDLK